MWGEVQYLLSEFSILTARGYKELQNIFEADNDQWCFEEGYFIVFFLKKVLKHYLK